ncbi:hypothetical protein AAHC03_016666 [Spirometra sp. Aus1]
MLSLTPRLFDCVAHGYRSTRGHLVVSCIRCLVEHDGVFPGCSHISVSHLTGLSLTYLTLTGVTTVSARCFPQWRNGVPIPCALGSTDELSQTGMAITPYTSSDEQHRRPLTGL